MKLGNQRLKSEHRVQGKQYLTLTFSTDPTKDSKTIRIPKMISGPLLITAVLIIFGILSVSNYVNKLEATIEVNDTEMMAVLAESQAKDVEITFLSEELNFSNEERYDQLVSTQEKTVELGLLLEELEQYREAMAEFKDEIDTNLSGSEDDEDTSDEDESNNDSEDELSLNDIEFLPDFMDIEKVLNGDEEAASVYALSIGPSGFNDTLSTATYDTVDFKLEIDKLNDYLDSAILEVNNGEEEFEETSGSLEEMIPYLEAYPGVLPIDDTVITSSFGYRRNPFGGYSSEFHTGVDLQAHYEDVKATGAGEVIVAKYLSGFGYTIVIDHGYGLTTKYAHNSDLYVSVGDDVVRGDVISKSGNTGRSTGPHLHYEVNLNGEPQNPIDYIYEEK